jgi:hypothetical protein
MNAVLIHACKYLTSSQTCASPRGYTSAFCTMSTVIEPYNMALTTVLIMRSLISLSSSLYAKHVSLLPC